MQTQTPLPPWSEYKPGDKNQLGETIKTIDIKTSRVVLYHVKEDNQLRWEYDMIKCRNSNEALGIAQALLTAAESQLPKNKISAVRILVETGLGTALNSDEEIPTCDFFKEAQLFMDSTLSELAHLHYVATAMICTACLSIPAILFYIIIGKNDIYYILVSAFFGGCGALVSLLQRFSTIPLPKYSTWRFIFVRALSRILIGAIFGALLVLFHKAGLILSVLGLNSFIIYSLAFISGVSERMVPELINDLQEQLIIANKKKTSE